VIASAIISERQRTAANVNVLIPLSCSWSAKIVKGCCFRRRKAYGGHVWLSGRYTQRLSSISTETAFQWALNSIYWNL